QLDAGAGGEVAGSAAGVDAVNDRAEGDAVAEAIVATAEAGKRAGAVGEIGHGAPRPVRLYAELIALHAEEVLQQEAAAKRVTGGIARMAVVLLAKAGGHAAVVVCLDRVIGPHQLGRAPSLVCAQ